MSEELKNIQNPEENEGAEKQPNAFVKAIRKIKSSKAILISIIVVSVLLVTFIGFSVYASTYENIFPGVTINGVDVGGMSVEDAEGVIQQEIINPIKDRNISLCCGNHKTTVSVYELTPGGIDPAGIAKQAYDVGHSKGWFMKTCSFIGSLFTDTDIKASIELDEAVLGAIVDELSVDYAKEVTETDFEVNGNVLTIIRGKGGRRVNMEKAIEQVSVALADTSVSEVVFEVEPAEPLPVNIDEFYERMVTTQDAYYKLEDGKVIIVDEVNGVVVDKAKVEAALNSGNDKTEITVEVKKADKTAEELKELLFRDVMGEWTTSYASSSAARANNVELAAKRMNGTILMPGDVFSYDKTIGSRTAANGYQSAGVYVGNKVESGIGGGICQPSSTLYGAVLYANLEIVTRTSHSLPVSYVPAGQDATVAEGYIDFQFKNNTEYPVKIVATYSNRQLLCQIVGVKPAGQKVEIIHSYTGTLAPKVEKVADASIPKGYKKTGSVGKQGSTYSSRRIVKIDGKEVKNEKLSNSVYNATSTEIRVNPADMNVSPGALIEYTGQVIPPEKPEDANPTDEKPNPENESEGEKPETGTGGEPNSEEVVVPETEGNNTGSDEPFNSTETKPVIQEQPVVIPSTDNSSSNNGSFDPETIPADGVGTENIE